ncbi:pyridoxal phosphate-dependent decarboxylase family protein [Parahaliea mediterranea]|uniref:Aminotransferase class I/II-fold pyridoxal phosphate-dependent enzyme n=1 Tax=Parahaliea mediterranea TaxID=651086 RepID=A0A939IP71_9GAMM|nr:aminotransferase class I/II-fold pyridoxal phosphate-dependent enzyme [Parahaliea mediterranea]MBN7798767.1 aminotransferase class I/II-fold pyridoxal phosphate-dependent enzyme [Parahaliea mediterranea]
MAGIKAEDTRASRSEADTLGMEAEEMRRLGHRVVDIVVDRLINRAGEPAILTGEADELLAQLGGPIPNQPLDPEESLRLLAEVAFTHQQRGDHPRYFARVPGPSSFGAILGDWLGTGFNAITASWAGGSGPATLELVVIDWLRQLLGLPSDYEGVLVSGGSHASLTAFAAVQAQRGTGTVYLTDQTHSSLPRALKVLGFSESQIHILPSDEQFRMPVQALREAIAGHRRAGARPLMVIGTAGTTNTGTVDPLPELAAICEAEELWLHVDAAYGGPGCLSASGREDLKGIELAHSLVLDPHKWLFQPYDAGCLLIRPGMLERSFDMNPEYLRDVTAGTGEVDFRNRGLELTRRTRAAKLWLSLRTYGVERFREAIDHGLNLAREAQKYLAANPRRWEIIVPAQLGIVCFALRGAGDDEHEERVRLLSESGYACISSTRLKGKTVFRLCTINPLTSTDDLEGTIDRLAALS